MVATRGVYPVGTISKLFNLTDRRIQQLVKDGVIPKADRGKYDLVLCVQGYVKYLQERAMGGDISTTDYGTENVRVKKLTADKLELEVDALKGKLIPVEEAEKELENLVMAARAKLLCLPSRLAKIAISAESLREIEDAAKQIVYECMEELSNDKSIGAVQVMAATAESNYIAMGSSIPIP